MKETGIVAKISDKYMYQRAKPERLFRADDDVPTIPLNLNHLMPMFTLAVTGLSLSFFVFLIELLMKHSINALQCCQPSKLSNIKPLNPKSK